MKYNDQVLILRTSVLHNLCVGTSVLHIQDEKMDDSQTKRQTEKERSIKLLNVER